jgi:hypothetical protein
VTNIFLESAINSIDSRPEVQAKIPNHLSNIVYIISRGCSLDQDTCMHKARTREPAKA